MPKNIKNKIGGGDTGAIYGLGMVGAAIYYIQNADTFMEGVFGLIKALVWPAIVIHKLLGFLQL